MRSVESHLAAVLAGVGPLAPVELDILRAQGCVLADDVTSALDLPPFDNSSMDGYAVRRADVRGAGAAPVGLTVTGDVAAGSPDPGTVGAGETRRIMTGAPVPAGADAVVQLEWTDGGTTTVRVDREPVEGANIRRRGEDVRAGEIVLRAGLRLGPAQVGLLASVGRDLVRVHPRPRVVVLSTGSELVEPGGSLGPGQIHDSNSYLLTAAARAAGAVAERVSAASDDPALLLATLESLLPRADVLVTTGGVSVGAYDVVKEVLSRLGTVSFDTVAMQPGKPQGHGTLGPGATPILTLPGNPVSAYVSFEVFARPLLRRLGGLPDEERATVRAECTEALRSPENKRQFVRASLHSDGGRHLVRPVGGAGSHLVGALARADALIVVPEGVGAVSAGETVDVIVLEEAPR